jgi:hypothetical protein
MANFCDCPRPPGGRVYCEDRQIAFCRVFNGETVSGCVSPPEETLRSLKTNDIKGFISSIASIGGLDPEKITNAGWVSDEVLSDSNALVETLPYSAQLLDQFMRTPTFMLIGQRALVRVGGEFLTGQVRLLVRLSQVVIKSAINKG